MIDQFAVDVGAQAIDGIQVVSSHNHFAIGGRQDRCAGGIEEVYAVMDADIVIP